MTGFYAALLLVPLPVGGGGGPTGDPTDYVFAGVDFSNLAKLTDEGRDERPKIKDERLRKVFKPSQ